MENFMDIVRLEKFMKRIVDHFDLLICAIILRTLMSAGISAA
jgi:hypothetical protein